jgi:hypothetical protein
MQETTMVSCIVYRLLKEGNSYVKNGKKVDRTDIILPRGYVEEKNYSWETNGLWHEKDEEKTTLFYEKQALKYKNKEKAQKKKGQLTEVMTEILDNANKPIELDEDVDELVLLKAEYFEKFGKKAHHLWKVDKLKEKLQ